MAALSAALQADTTVVLNRVERDLTGDGKPEVLRLVGTGKTVDSLNVTFIIESAGQLIYQTMLMPLTRTIGFDAGRRRISAAEHRARLREFGTWFFGAGKFMTRDQFVERLRDSAPRHIAEIPQMIAWDRRRKAVVDSLMATGLALADAERRAPRLVGAQPDTAGAARIWQNIRTTRVTVFEFSPGGDGLTTIGWNTADRRFYHLLSCC
jgi:hypothetical protein